MNLRPSGYEPDELPDCSTPRAVVDEELRPGEAILHGQLAGAIWPGLGLAGLAAPYSSAA